MATNYKGGLAIPWSEFPELEAVWGIPNMGSEEID